MTKITKYTTNQTIEFLRTRRGYMRWSSNRLANYLNCSENVINRAITALKNEGCWINN